MAAEPAKEHVTNIQYIKGPKIEKKNVQLNSNKNLLARDQIYIMAPVYIMSQVGHSSGGS